MTKQIRDHRKEHVGCSAIFPWLRACKRYKSVEHLLQMCLDDIADLPANMVTRKVSFLSEHPTLTHRDPVRSKYIGWRERWYEDDIACETESAGYFFDDFAVNGIYQGMSKEEYIQQRIYLKQQLAAITVLYAYGMFDKNGNILKSPPLHLYARIITNNC